jgi:hypothetical protein
MKQQKDILILIATICYLSSCGQSQPTQKKQIKADTTKQSNQSGTIQFKETPIKLKVIVSKIEAVNEVQSAHVGVAGVESDNYRNFLDLKKAATVNDLVQLTDNKNAVVACYSAMALADQSYLDLKTIFVKFLDKDRQVSTFSGCIQSEDLISSELYHQYWNNVDDNARAKDKILIQLDSVILFHKNIYWLLTTRALENRVYGEPYKTQIASLAFDKGKNDAIYYLCNWHKAEYADKLKAALLKYLKKTKFSNTGTTDYYKTIEQLFSFRDEKITKEIVAKMKKDRHWEMEKERFKFILADNNIYDIDSE